MTEKDTIYGLYLNESGNSRICQGLFGFLEDGSISHVHIRSSLFIGHNFVGAICGYIKGSYLKGTAQVSHCSNNSTVESSRNHAGGIVGFSEGCNRITNCHNSGTIRAKRYAGGIVGYFQDGTIVNCYNRGHIDIFYESAGGIIGEYYENPYRGFMQADTIANCYNTGIVSGRDVVGGIIGNLQLYSKEFVPQKIQITNCYNAGMLKSTYPVTTDGIVGCYTYYQTEKEMFKASDFNRGSFKNKLHNEFRNIIYELDLRNILLTKNEDGDDTPPRYENPEEWGTGTAPRLERYSGTNYWSDQCCIPVGLTEPRFNANIILSQYWSELMRYPDNCKRFECREDASMKKREFVKQLNKWVQKEEKKLRKKERTAPFLLTMANGYPQYKRRLSYIHRTRKTLER
ncbi:MULTISPECIES: GLUG motif-containing protein [Bacteroides]|uniref:GLUG motif-containing protein n=1 Tax=Bacteroides TaxID=816 RepID=UPI00319DED0A